MNRSRMFMISGNAGSGKTTAIEYLKSKDINKRIKEYALADKLKELTFKLLKLFGVEIESLYDLHDPKKKVPYRKYLQQIGTECCRGTFGDNFWCEVLMRDILEEICNDDIIFITDLRYINEYTFFMNHFDVKVIKIVRDVNVLNHSSESEIQNIPEDYIVLNNSTLKDMYLQLDELWNTVMNDFVQEIEPELYHKFCMSSIEIESDVEDEPQKIESKDEEYKVEPQNIEPQKIIESSYQMGRNGESEVMSMITNLRPDFETSLVSSTGHVGDIHVIDHKCGIMYMVEVKYKHSITRDDVLKYYSDLDSMRKSNITMNVIGLFISLISNNIPSIGEYLIERNSIIIGKRYYTKELLELVFNYSALLFKNSCSGSIQIQDEIPKVKYELSPQILELLARLRAEYNMLDHEKSLLSEMKLNTEHNLSFVNELISRILIKEQFIRIVNMEFESIIPSNVKIEDDDAEFRNYMNTHSKSNIKKKDLLEKFPIMRTKISAMKLDDIIKTYKSA